MKNLLIILCILSIATCSSLRSQSTIDLQNVLNQYVEENQISNISNSSNLHCTNPEISFGYQYMFNSAPSSMSLIETLTDSTFIIVYASVPNMTSYAVIGTITDTVISYGQPIMFGYRVQAMCRMDSNTLLFAIRLNYPFTDTYKVLVADVTGNSIVFLNEEVYSNLYTEYSSLSALDHENFIIGYSNYYTYHDSEIFVKKGQLLGNTILLSDSVSVAEGQVTSLGTVALDSSNFVVYYECNGGDSRPGKIVGDSIVLGPVTPFTNNGNPGYITATAMCDTTFVLGYGYWTICGIGIVGTLKDNSISYGTPVVFDSTRVEGIYATTMDSNRFVFSYCDREATSETTSTTVLGTVSGYDITFGDEYTSSLNTSTQRAPIATLDPNHFVVGLIDFTQSWSGGSKIGTIEPCHIQTSISDEVNCGGIVPVPILVNSVDHINQFSLFLEYDTSSLTYISYQNANSQLIDDSLYINDFNGILNIQYNSNIPISILSDTLVDIIFNVEGGPFGDTNHLLWNDSMSYYINSGQDSIDSYFINGTLSSYDSIGSIGQVSGNDSVCFGTPYETFTISSIENCSAYIWDLTPVSAGQVQAIDTAAVVIFEPDFSGDAMLSVFGTSLCGTSDTSLLNINVVMTPTANAGPDTIICESSDCQMSGMALNYDHIYWATLGDGSFDYPFNLNSIYSPGIEDIENGEVSLILFSYAVNPCLGEVGDTLKLSITKLPEVDAGTDDTTCFDMPYLLDGTATNYSGVSWMTSGDGTFDNLTQLSTFYNPGPEDRENGEVYLVLTGSSNYPCEESISDTLELVIVDYPNTPSTPQGPVIINLDTCYTSEYYTDTIGNVDYYNWFLNPSDAGIIAGSDNIAVVNWNNTYSGLLAYVYVEVANICGNEFSDSLVVDVSPVMIDKYTSDLSIFLFPNPASTHITLSHPNTTLQLHSIQGQIILTSSPGDQNISLEGVAPGVYIATIYEKGKVIGREKLIVK